jgi:hypothetical protein
LTKTQTSTPTPSPTKDLTPITESTEINIWFDNSGSMNSTLTPLQEMRDDLLQACLLPIYNNDISLYNEKVKVLEMSNPPEWEYFERFIKCLSTERNFQRTPDSSVTLVINLTFADESDVYGYGQGDEGIPFNNLNRTTTYDSDVTILRNVLSTITYTIKGTAFRVNTGPNTWPGFRGLTEATFVNTGVYSPPYNVSDYSGDFNYSLDVVGGSTASYYLGLIQSSLTSLGISLPPC